MTTSAHVRQVLVEFPGILLAAFQPTLEAIQRMSKYGDVPFAAALVPETAHTDDKKIRWPRYTDPPRFSWDLSPITGDQNPLNLNRYQDLDLDSLKQYSTLDDAQCKALIAALS